MKALLSLNCDACGRALHPLVDRGQILCRRCRMSTQAPSVFIAAALSCVVACSSPSGDGRAPAQGEQYDRAFAASYSGAEGAERVACDPGDSVVLGSCVANGGRVTESEQDGSGWACAATPDVPSKGMSLIAFVRCARASADGGQAVNVNLKEHDGTVGVEWTGYPSSRSPSVSASPSIWRVTSRAGSASRRSARSSVSAPIDSTSGSPSRRSRHATR